MTTLQIEYEKMKKTVTADSSLTDEEKFRIMFGQPYVYKYPWKGVVKKPAK